MQTHEEPTPESSSAAAQTRVTAEELTAAITRLEAQKETGQQRLTATIPIGEAVQQLGLDATPAQVLAEIQAGRARQKSRRAVRRRLIAGAALVVAGSAVWARMLSGGAQEQDTPPPAFVAAVPAVSVPAPAATPIAFSPTLQVRDASGRLVLLSEVGDGQPMRCLLGPDAGTLADYAPGGDAPTWVLVKHDGRVYLRGYTPRVSEKLLTTRGVRISSDAYDDSVVPVTLPLSGFRVTPGSDTPVQVLHQLNLPASESADTVPEAFAAQDVHPDQYAREKF